MGEIYHVPNVLSRGNGGGGSRITLTPMISIRHEAEARLNDLLKTRGNLTSLMDAKVKLSQLYDRVLENVQHSTPEIKALALDALDIKVYAQGTDNVEIQGVIPVELPTTARTLGCISSPEYDYMPFRVKADSAIRSA